MWIKISTGPVDSVDIFIDPFMYEGFVRVFENGICFSCGPVDNGDVWLLMECIADGTLQ
jgi:hypothetical protein